ncbi:hypothetical protein, partial [Geobacillus sp. FW23]
MIPDEGCELLFATLVGATKRSAVEKANVVKKGLSPCYDGDCQHQPKTGGRESMKHLTTEWPLLKELEEQLVRTLQ